MHNTSQCKRGNDCLSQSGIIPRGRILIRRRYRDRDENRVIRGQSKYPCQSIAQRGPFCSSDQSREPFSDLQNIGQVGRSFLFGPEKRGQIIAQSSAETPIRSVPLFLTMEPLTESSQEVPVSEGFQAQPSLKLTPFPPEGYFQLMALAPIL